MSELPTIRITRSDRRRKTVAARLVDDGATLEILAPAGATDDDLAPLIERLKVRLLARKERLEHADDRTLARRASELNRQYFEGKLRWREIRYVHNQQHRYGSCTPAEGTIRISHRVATMPTWVRDYVIVHEMAHLLEANHSSRFWALVNRYPKSERARGYLIALGWEGDEETCGAHDASEGRAEDEL